MDVLVIYFYWCFSFSIFFGIVADIVASLLFWTCAFVAHSCPWWFLIHCYIITRSIALFSFSISGCQNKLWFKSNNGLSDSISFSSLFMRTHFAQDGFERADFFAFKDLLNFSVISQLNKRVSSNLIGRAVPYMTLYKPLQAVYITFSRPGYWACHLSHLGKRTWRTVLNEFSIYLEDITVSPGYLRGWRIFKMTAACSPWTKKPLKNSYSRQLGIVNVVVSWSPAGHIDWPKSVFLQTKATHFETMMTTVDEVSRDKTKVPD